MTRITLAQIADAALVIALVLLAIATAGCSSMAAPLAVAAPVEVPLPLPVPCIAADHAPQRPPLSRAEDLRALGDYELVLTIERERRLLRDYEAQAAAVIAACIAGR